MNLRYIFTINAIVWMGMGIAFAVYAPLAMALWGIADIPQANVFFYWNVASFIRLYGAALFGAGLLLLSARDMMLSVDTQTNRHRRLASAMALGNVLGLFVSITQQVQVWNRPAGLVLIGIYGLFAFLYGVILLTNRS